MSLVASPEQITLTGTRSSRAVTLHLLAAEASSVGYLGIVLGAQAPAVASADVTVQWDDTTIRGSWSATAKDGSTGSGSFKGTYRAPK